MQTQEAFLQGRLTLALGAGLIVLAIATALVLSSRQADANDIAPFQTVFGTDVASAGYGGMRSEGTGTITLSGVSGTVTQALLYWHGPTDTADTTANESPTFAGSTISGTNIGLSSDNCWDYTNSQAYRADVTSLVTGDGAYSLADFITTDVDINGVSLIVFFNDGNDTNNRDIVMFDGNDSNVNDNGFDADGWNVTLDGINYESGAASMDLHVADGQDFDDGTIVLNGTTTLDAGPGLFQGDTVPNGPNDNSGGLWDIRSFDVTSDLTVGPNTLTLTHDYVNDCLSLIVAMVNLPGGAAPGQPTPQPTVQPTGTPPATAAPQPTSTAAAIALPQTGAGSQSATSGSAWLIVALMAGAGLAVAGYGAIRLAGRRA